MHFIISALLPVRARIKQTNNHTSANQNTVSDCGLRQLSKFSATSWREQVNIQWDDSEVCFVLDQHAELEFYSVIFALSPY